jgi:Na+/H+ antiporter NhaD/arsenite permease-like protein
MEQVGRRIGCVLSFSRLLTLTTLLALAATTANGSELRIHGEILSKSGSPLGDARVELYLNGRPYEAGDHATSTRRPGSSHVTDKDGLFRLTIAAPTETVLEGDWALRITKPGFRGKELIPVPRPREQESRLTADRHYVSMLSVFLDRTYGTAFWISSTVLLLVYGLIAVELVHRTTAALLGAALILFITHTLGRYWDSFSILTWSQALRAIDWNVIFLLMGMMIIVAVLKASGLFQWLAYKAFQMARGRVFVLAALLVCVTALLSAVLDNVTTMLLLAPVTLEAAAVLGISPIALLMPQILASNFGGTATLIGDPPNIMIGSYAGLSFNDFVVSLGPLVIITLVLQIAYSKWYYGYPSPKDDAESHEEKLARLREKYRITDPRLLKISGMVLVVVIGLFVLHGVFEMEVSVIALMGAAAVLILTGKDLAKILEHEVEWTALIFFIMLFIVVGAAQETGLLELIATRIQGICGDNLTLAILVILWTSGIASAIVDNIPFTATMIPIIAYLNQTVAGAESGVLWWALAVGACFGGNGTLVGASANVVTASIAERAGHRITFGEFLKHGAPITLLSLLLSSLYLMIF